MEGCQGREGTCALGHPELQGRLRGGCGRRGGVCTNACLKDEGPSGSQGSTLQGQVWQRRGSEVGVSSIFKAQTGEQRGWSVVRGRKRAGRVGRGLASTSCTQAPVSPAGPGPFCGQTAFSSSLEPGVGTSHREAASSWQASPSGAGTRPPVPGRRPGGILAAGRRERGNRDQGAPSLTLLVSYRQGAECTSAPLWGQSWDADTPRRW